MGSLNQYSDWYYEPADLIDEDEDDQPAMPPEALSVSLGAVWWTAAPILDADD